MSVAKLQSLIAYISSELISECLLLNKVHIFKALSGMLEFFSHLVMVLSMLLSCPRWLALVGRIKLKEVQIVVVSDKSIDLVICQVLLVIARI